MKTLVRTLVFIGILVFWGIMVAMGIRADYHYNQDYLSYWSLADKASTISQKSDYINQFVNRLQNSDLQGQNDALYFKTPDNSFDKNFEALKSLQGRLEEIKNLDPNSFAYQTAIQQITAQEQGQADSMLSVFQGVWYKTHYYWLWNVWLVLGSIIFPILLGVIVFAATSDDF